MPVVDLVPQTIVRAGLEPDYESPLTTTDTYQVPNNGRTFLHFKKSGAGDCTVTLVTPGKVDGLAIADRTVTVEATTGDVMVGPFPPSTYNDADGKMAFTLSEITGLSVAVLRL